MKRGYTVLCIHDMRMTIGASNSYFIYNRGAIKESQNLWQRVLYLYQDNTYNLRVTSEIYPIWVIRAGKEDSPYTSQTSTNRVCNFYFHKLVIPAAYGASLLCA